MTGDTFERVYEFRRHGYELRTKIRPTPERLAASRGVTNANRRHLEAMEECLRALASYPAIVECLREEKIILDRKAEMTTDVAKEANRRLFVLRKQVRALTN